MTANNKEYYKGRNYSIKLFYKNTGPNPNWFYRKIPELGIKKRGFN